MSVLKGMNEKTDIEIKTHYTNEKRKKVRRNIVPGNSKSLWDAVKCAKNLNTEKLPSQMFKNDIQIEDYKLEDTFADYFEEKIIIVT